MGSFARALWTRYQSRLESLARGHLVFKRQTRRLSVLYHFRLLARQADNTGLAARQRQLELLALLYRSSHYAHLPTVPARTNHFPIDERGRLQGGHPRVVPRLGAFGTDARRPYLLVHSYGVPLLFDQPAIAAVVFASVQITRKQYGPILHGHHPRYALH